MADNKKYVRVGNFAVKDAFDNKYKTSLPKLMKTTVEKAINGSSKLTAKPPTDKDAKGFSMEKFFGKLDGKKAVDLLEDVINGKATEGVKKAIESAFEKAKGSEGPEKLGTSAAAEFTNTSLKNLEGEIAKRVKNA